MSSRLPKPGGDSGDWGSILNDFLEVAHNSDGSLKPSAVTAAGAGTYSKPAGGIPATDLTSSVQTDLSQAANAVQLAGDLGGSVTDPTVSRIQGTSVNGSSPTDGQVLTYDSTAYAWVPGTISSTTVNDATTSSKGIIELAGNLGGTASSPTVVATSLTSPLPVNQGGTGATTQPFVDLTTNQTIAGTKTFGSTIMGNISGNAATATTANTVTTIPALTGDVTSSGSSNATMVNKVQGISISNTAPTANQVLTASNGTTAAWTTPATAPVTSVAGKTGVITLATTDLTDTSITSPTNNQVLAYNSTTSKWTNETPASAPVSSVFGRTGTVTAQTGDYTASQVTNALPTTTATTKGDLLAATAASTITRLGVGSDGQVLTAASGQTTGLQWAAPSSAPVTSVAGRTGAIVLAESDITNLTSDLTARVQVGGDLSGTATSPTVAKINGVSVSGTPASNSILVGSSSTAAAWQAAPLTLAQGGTGSTTKNFVDLSSAQTVAGNKTWSADQYFESGRPWYDVIAFGADPTGAADSYTAIQAAVTAAIASSGGIVFFPVGSYKCGTGLVATSGSKTITLLGVGGITGGASGGSHLLFTGTGSGSFITANSSAGFHVKDLQLLYSSTSFTGNILDLRNVSASDTAFFRVEGCLIGGAGISTATAGIAIDKANTGTIEGCNFINSTYGITGAASGGSYSNNNQVRGCQFVNLGTAGILNPGQGWVIDGNTFEGLASGGAGGIICNAGTFVGSSITSNWFGDVTASVGGTQISVSGGGFSVTGNYVGFNTGATGIAIGASNIGFTITGNQFAAASGVTAIMLGSNCSAYDCSRNSTGGVSMTFPSPLIDAVSTGIVSATTATVDGVSITGSATTGQVLTASSSSAASWSTPTSGAQALTPITTPNSGVVQNTNSPFTAAAGTFIPVDASGGNVTISLPFQPADQTRIAVKLVNNASPTPNTVTINVGTGSGNDYFNKASGATSETLSLLNQGVMLQYDHASGLWYVKSDDLPLSQLDSRYPQRAAGTSSPAAPLTYYNPVDDGAAFNGSTDDSADLNVTLARGSTILFPPGTTSISANMLRFQTSNVHIRGSGMYDTTVKCANGSLAAMWLYPASGFVSQVELSDMTIDAGGTAVAEALATIGSRLDRLRIRRCRFVNFQSIIIFGGYAAELIIEDCEADGAGLGQGTFLSSTNVENEVVIMRRNRLRWLNTGITIGSGNPGSNQYHSAHIDISDNYIDLGWWLLKATQSNSGGGVTYSGTSISDASNPFGSIAAGTTVRVLTPLQTGTLTTIGTQMTDSSGNFITNNVWRGHIVRCGTAFGVVSKVETATQLHVEEWLSQTTYQPVTPPTSASYTIYGVVLGATVSASAGTINIAHGGGGNGGGWYDLQGNSVTPSSATLYEVLPAHPVYPIFCNVPTEKVKISRNTVRRGWADNIEFFGSRGIITDNIVEDGQDEGIVCEGYSVANPGIKNVVSNNICRHNGTSGLNLIDQADCEVGPNQLEDNTWGAPSSFNVGQLQIANCINTTVTGGRATNSGESAINQVGMSISGASISGVKVIGFSAHGSAVGDAYIASTVPAATCDLLDIDGTLTYQGTTNGQRLRVKGTGAPSLIAAPGSLFLSTSGGGSGTTLYVKESATDNTGWDVMSTGSSGLLTATAVKTSTYTAASGDYVRCDSTSGAFTVTLPNAPAVNTVVGVKLIASAATVNAVTVACGGSDVINKTGGSTSYTISLINQGATFQYGSGGIWLIQNDDLPLGQLDNRYTKVFSPMAFGAAGNGTTDDTTAVQAAYTAAAGGGTVDLSGHAYLTSSAITLSSGTRTFAPPWSGSTSSGAIVNSTSDIFSVTGTVTGVVFDGGCFEASAGHVWNASTASCAQWVWRNCTAAQNGTGKRIWYMSAGLYLDMIAGEGCYFQAASGATVEPWYVVSNANGANSSTWRDHRVSMLSASGGTVPFFHLENTSAGYGSNNRFAGITAEQCSGGILVALSQSQLTIDNVTGYDVTTYNENVFTIGTGSGSGLASRIITARNSGWVGGALGGGVYDFSAPSVQDVILENVGPQSTGYTPVYNIAPSAVVLGLGTSSFAALQDPLQIGVTVDFFPGVITINQSVFTANNGYYMRLVSGGYAVSNLNIVVGTSSGNISAATYTNSGTGLSIAPTGGRLATSGAIACPATGAAAVSLGSTVIPNLSDWVALSADNTTATFQRCEVNTGSGALSLPGWSLFQGSAHPLPSTPSSLVANASIGLFMMRGS